MPDRLMGLGLPLFPLRGRWCGLGQRECLGQGNGVPISLLQGNLIGLPLG